MRRLGSVGEAYISQPPKPSLLAGFVRSGTGWGMELSLQGQ